MTEIIPNKFSLGGTTNSSLNFYVLDGWKRPLSPGTEDRTAKVLGRAGNIWIDSKLSSREFSIPGYFIASSTANLDTYARALAAMLVDVYGKPRQLQLIFADESDKYYLVRYDSAIPLSRFIDQMRGTFEIPLIADDPYAYELEDATTITFTTSGATPGEIVTSSGNVETPAKFCITNTGATAVNGFTIKVNYEV